MKKTPNWIQDPGSRIQDPGSRIKEPGSRIPDQKKKRKKKKGARSWKVKDTFHKQENKQPLQPRSRSAFWAAPPRLPPPKFEPKFIVELPIHRPGGRYVIHGGFAQTASAADGVFGVCDL